MKTQSCLSVSLLSLGAALCLSIVGRADVEDTLQKSFSIPPGGSLVIDADRGSIDVSPGNGGEMTITVKRVVTRGSEAKAKQLLADHHVEFAQDGNTVTVRARLEGNWKNWGWNSPNLNVRYTVSLPKKFNVDLKTAGGGIKVGPLEGTMKAGTAGGNIVAESVDGPVTARTSGGSVEVGSATGAAMLRTSGGNIRLGQMKGTVDAETSGGSVTVQQAGAKTLLRTSGGNITVERADAPVDAETSGGSIRLSLAGSPAADCVVRTSGGNIRLALPENAAANLDAGTSGGSVKSDLPVTVQGEIKHASLVGKLGGGGHLIKARTSGGSIYLEKASW